eukprot:6281861-Prymnesium_polylepis.1
MSTHYRVWLLKKPRHHGTTSKLNKAKLFKPCTPVGKMASAYRPGTKDIMQPVQEDIIALLNHHGLVGDDAARAL